MLCEIASSGRKLKHGLLLVAAGHQHHRVVDLGSMHNVMGQGIRGKLLEVIVDPPSFLGLV